MKDLNCDLGEGMANDKEIMPFITSCNIACGEHAGDKKTMANTIKLAKKHNVKIGAHPSYPGHDHFGRISININPKALEDSIYQQITQLKEICDKHNSQLHHVKAHGALYHDVIGKEEIQAAFTNAIKKVDPNLIVYSSKDIKGLKVHKEGFIDRRYTKQKELTPRTEPNAILHSKEECLSQIHQIENLYQTFCIHGDNPNAPKIIKHIAQKWVRYQPYSESGWLLEWPQKIAPEILWSILSTKETIEELLKIKCIHTYSSLWVPHKNIMDIKDIVRSININERTGSLHLVNVFYDTNKKYDLANLAEVNKLSIEEAIETHSNTDYLIYFLGFLPGFPYLGGLHHRLHQKRKPEPQIVPKGAVAIGGWQTGIYPQDSPGGWHVIGLTDFSLQPTSFKPGDIIRFVPK